MKGAVYYPTLDQYDDSCIVEGDSFHHLKNVLRVRVNDEILFLDGRGHSRRAIINVINKKNMECTFTQD